MVATVPVQHRTLPEEGYDAALHIVVCKGSGHGICIHMHSSKLITCVCYFEYEGILQLERFGWYYFSIMWLC